MPSSTTTTAILLILLLAASLTAAYFIYKYFTQTRAPSCYELSRITGCKMEKESCAPVIGGKCCSGCSNPPLSCKFTLNPLVGFLSCQQ